MNCVWFGGENAGTSVSAINYNSPVASFSLNWTTPAGARSIPVSEDIIITKFTLYSDTAPGAAASGKQYTFAVNVNGSNTLASMILLETATSVSWSGAVSVTAGDFVALSATPLNTPTLLTNHYWIIEYTTNGQQFLMPGGSHGGSSATVTNYAAPGGSSGVSGLTVVTDREIVVPASGTITKLTAKLDAVAGAGTSYDASIRLNNISDNLTANIAGAVALSGSTAGSIAVVAGDTLVLKIVPNGTPTSRRVTVCLTIQPAINGENFFGFGTAGAPSTAAANFEQPIGDGNNSWNATENLRYMKPPAYDFKKLYIKLTTAPGVGKSRAFVMMDNGSPTALTATVFDAATTANDTTHTVTMSGGGNPASMRTTPAGTPTATLGVHLGYVVAVTQPATTIRYLTSRPPWMS